MVLQTAGAVILAPGAGGTVASVTRPEDRVGAALALFREQAFYYT